MQTDLFILKPNKVVSANPNIFQKPTKELQRNTPTSILLLH